MKVVIAASRARLAEVAREVEEAASRGGDVEVEIEAGDNNAPWALDRPNSVTLAFSNDDMEDRDDLAPDVVIVDVEP